jgi:Zn-dependent protease
MFGHVQPTPYDLSFSLFGIPVRVLPWFWLMAVVMGFDLFQIPGRGPALLLAWVVIVFVSILIHELGHATAALLFGYPPRILMYHFGGLAMFEPHWGYTAAKSIIISLAGPGAGFVFYGITRAVRFVMERGGTEISPFAGFVFGNLEWVNLWWGLVNLLPVHPLDGGQVCREVLTSLNAQRGMRWTLYVGVATGAAAAAVAFYYDERYAAILMGALAIGCYMELQERQSW